MPQVVPVWVARWFIVVEGEGGRVRALRHIGLAGLRLRAQRRSEQETNQGEEHRTAIT